MQNLIRVAFTLLCLLIASEGAYAGSGAVVVRSHCPITGATGIGRGTDLWSRPDRSYRGVRI